MGSFGRFDFSKNHTPSPDSLTYSPRSGLNGKFSVVRFKDKDTHQFIYYAPNLEISSYGETVAKAEEMFKFLVDDFLSGLLKHSADHVRGEILKLGWVKDGLWNKKFSKMHIDINGELKNYNVEEGSLEHLQMVA